jgi:hypothetical protein
VPTPIALGTDSHNQWRDRSIEVTLIPFKRPYAMFGLPYFAVPPHFKKLDFAWSTDPDFLEKGWGQRVILGMYRWKACVRQGFYQSSSQSPCNIEVLATADLLDRYTLPPNFGYVGQTALSNLIRVILCLSTAVFGHQNVTIFHHSSRKNRNKISEKWFSRGGKNQLTLFS